MIWHIRQCRFCHKQGNCDYKKTVKEQTKQLTKTHVTHNCPEYKKLFRVGQRVKIQLHYREPDYEAEIVWKSAGFVTGTITGRIYRLKFWEIQLDKTMKLARWKDGEMREHDFSHYIKPANKIEVLEDEFGELKKTEIW